MKIPFTNIELGNPFSLKRPPTVYVNEQPVSSGRSSVSEVADFLKGKTA
jgi:hypothetical protein